VLRLLIIVSDISVGRADTAGNLACRVAVTRKRPGVGLSLLVTRVQGWMMADPDTSQAVYEARYVAALRSLPVTSAGTATP
jgi:hypothetical protein